MDTNKFMNDIEQLLNTLDEPSCIAINIGERVMFLQNDKMLSEEQQFKSTVFHCMSVQLCTHLTLCLDDK